MKVLVLGPSGSGKTYVSKSLQKAGVNAFDDADIPGLSNWYDRNGRKVAEPKTAEEALNNHYSFLWSRKTMASFLSKYDDVYVFGGSGNVSRVFDLFDKVYFLKIDPKLQRQRLQSADRQTPDLDKNEDGIVIWGDWFEQLAIEHHIPFINADQTPDQIFQLVSAEIS